MQGKVAVIDIGSNTIKLLVAEQNDRTDQLQTVFRKTLETRIGQGISAARPVLSHEAITRASDAVASLFRAAAPFEPDEIRIVATSAARDAANGDELGRAILEKTGTKMEILSGQREAELIGLAIQSDPQITARDFYVFDLGGGSLECLSFSNRRLDQVVSLPLGCVRLAEKLLADPAAIFTAADEERIGREVDDAISDSGFTFSLPAGSIAVGTGGTLTTALNIAAAQQGRDLEEMPPYLACTDLRALLTLAGGRSLPDRLAIPRLSAGRADVFPTALATFLKLADLTKQDRMYHSSFNLRYGLSAEMLSQVKG